MLIFHVKLGKLGVLKNPNGLELPVDTRTSL